MVILLAGCGGQAASAAEPTSTTVFAHDRLAYAYLQLGNYAEAAKHYALTLDLSHPQNRIAGRYCMLGQAQDWAEEPQAALVNYRICVDGLEDEALVGKHGVTFEEAAEVFFDPFYQTGDASVDDNEQRDFIVGYTFYHHLLLVVYTERNVQTRIISARPATRAERKAYENNE